VHALALDLAHAWKLQRPFSTDRVGNSHCCAVASASPRASAIAVEALDAAGNVLGRSALTSARS
jgi:hypothetical protein